MESYATEGYSPVSPAPIDHNVISSKESFSLGMLNKLGGILLQRLNIVLRPIANK